MGARSRGKVKARTILSRAVVIGSLAAVTLLVSSFFPSAAFGARTRAPAPAPTLVRCEQTDSRLAYSGAWDTLSSSSDSAGSVNQTTGAGATVTIRFDGTRLEWIARKGSSFGIAKVTLDGKTPVSVDLYNSTTLYKQGVWSTGTISSGPHTVTIECTGTKRTKAHGTAITIDAVDVVGSILPGSTTTTLAPVTTTTKVATTTTTVPTTTTTVPTTTTTTVPTTTTTTVPTTTTTVPITTTTAAPMTTTTTVQSTRAFYVDATNGNDANSGLAPGAAWKTLSKVNSTGFLPADSVLLKRGETWRGQLVIPSSGSAGKPITVGAYGTGAKPLIMGSLNLSNTVDWTADVGSDDTFTTYEDFAARTRTTASVAWNKIGAWVDDDATWYDSPDISGIVQEIVNLAEWESGRGMVLFLADNNSASGAYRQAKGYEDGPTRCPVLTITTSAGIVTARPSVSSDDVTARSSNLVATDLVMGNNSGVAEGMGIRFADVTIPRGATILSAKISFRANGFQSGATCNVTIKGGAQVHPLREALANVWVTTVGCPLDIGNLIFNNEASVGWKQSGFAGLDTQGDFYWQGGRLYVYSTANPGAFYNRIEAAQAQNGVQIDGLSHIIVQNLDLRYFGTMGVSVGTWPTYDVHDILVEYCDISWIGGSINPGDGNRYGNGIQFWVQANDVIVRYNKLDQIYDAALSPQMGGEFRRQSWYRNIVTNSEYGFELFCLDGTLEDILVAHNVFYQMGHGWSRAQRPDKGRAAGLTFGAVASAVTRSNVVFANNIIFDPLDHAVSMGDCAAFTGFTFEHNCYYGAGLTFSCYDGAYNLANWQTHTGWDANSIDDDPVFVNTTDFRLSATSPCIDAGGVFPGVGQTVIGPAPDMGVYEWTPTT